MTAPVTDAQLTGLIAAERQGLAAVLTELPDEAWDAPRSAPAGGCGRWSRT